MSTTTIKTIPTANSSHPQRFGNGAVRVCRRGRGGNGGGNDTAGSDIVLVALSRPKSRNALNDATYEDLTALLRLAKRDDTIGAVVLTGTGQYFSSGADLKENFEAGAFVPRQEGRRSLHLPVGQFMLELVSFPKLLAAAVQGPVRKTVCCCSCLC